MNTAFSIIRKKSCVNKTFVLYYYENYGLKIDLILFYVET